MTTAILEFEVEGEVMPDKKDEFIKFFEGVATLFQQKLFEHQRLRSKTRVYLK